jgi:putative ABC transport system ATP-binding protein
MGKISLRGVTKTYHRDAFEVKVLDGISLEMEQGDFLAVMGPSGSGKTTLLNLLAGLDRPDQGEVDVAGTLIHGLSESQLARWRSRHVGFVFQFYNLIPVLTAYENVELPLLLQPLSKAERRRHVEAALAIVGLSDRMEHYPRQLSGGQEQRVAIARAVVTDPAVILADEPTGDLDTHSSEEILALLGELNVKHGKTILMVTHDPRAARSAKSVRYLDKGVFTEAPAGLLAH